MCRRAHWGCRSWDVTLFSLLISQQAFWAGAELGHTHYRKSGDKLGQVTGGIIIYPVGNQMEKTKYVKV